ncbi:hypothetical protein BKA66DRAFT_426242 [Pyrenochaeta sp. MPI-SDFR-AT-0127]|nr:hypothetical protein BKA66DRAFT_426242 [Pyrenochaeta sp. MPI-SDFR-AT-0127]
MARGNQRDKAREKNLKAAAGTQSGTEFARTKEDQAAIMRAKQAAGNVLPRFLPNIQLEPFFFWFSFTRGSGHMANFLCEAEAKKAGEGAAKK